MTKLLTIGLILLSCGVVEAKDLVRAEGRSVNEQARAAYGVSAAPSPKQVIIPYDDFLVMLSKVEHKDKLLNQCMAEKGILVKLHDENGTIKRLNLQQVEALEGEVEAHRKLGETQEQIVQAVEHQLSGIIGELNREKRLSRYKSETVWIGLIGLVVWVLN